MKHYIKALVWAMPLYQCIGFIFAASLINEYWVYIVGTAFAIAHWLWAVTGPVGLIGAIICTIVGWAWCRFWDNFAPRM